MRKMVLVLLGVLVLGMPALVLAANTQDVSVVVTPIVAASLTASPTFYSFGNVNLSTQTVATSSITVTNNGTVGINLEKTVWADAGWDITLSTGVQDGFDLWLMSNASAPGVGTYTSGNAHNFIKTLQTYNNLTNSSGVQVNLGLSASTGVWFRLDTPTNVGSGSQQTIIVRLKAIAQ